MGPALEDFKTTLDLEPDQTCIRAEALFNYGSILEGRGRNEEALAAYKECLTLSTNEEVEFPEAAGEEAAQAIMRRLQAKVEQLSG